MGASEQAGRNASERRAGLETGNVSADPPEIRGRPQSSEQMPPIREGSGPSETPEGLTGVVAVACLQEGMTSNTGNPSGADA